MFIYENGILTAKDKKYNEIAMIKTIDENTFFDKIGKFPDCDMVITTDYEKTAFDQISFDHNLYFNLCDIFNLPGNLFNMSFIGKYKPIYVKPNDESLSNAIALIMPVKFN
jgi:DNA polymerase III sliding clamp (beta) subunit (PCNA family)